jgi:hypothetical protein
MITIDITKAKKFGKIKLERKKTSTRTIRYCFVKAQETSSDTTSIVADKQL